MKKKIKIISKTKTSSSILFIILVQILMKNNNIASINDMLTVNSAAVGQVEVPMLVYFGPMLLV